MLKAAILGFGTVGSGTLEVLERNADTIARNAGEAIEVKYILDLRDFPNEPHQERFVKDFAVIENDPEVSIVIETMGGKGAAYTFTKRSLEAGKNVVTSNKELVATHGAELLEIAAQKNVNYLFEASVGGGIPIIRPMQRCLTANHLTQITGILNGTTNYILNRMIDGGLDFATALKEAQELGYAEANPAADVEGIDACRKVCILADIAYGDNVAPEKVETEGITAITLQDVAYAEQADSVVKLLGRTVLQEDGTFYAFVAPHFVKKSSPLACVTGVFNGILVTGDMLGDAMFYGQGAGKEATASAVVADVIEEAQVLGTSVMSEWSPEKQVLTDVAGTEKRFFVRMRGNAAQLEKAEQIFGKIEIVDAGVDGEFGFVTDVMTEAAYRKCASQTDEILSMIRIREK